MDKFYFKKGEKVGNIQAIVADLETRLSALRGDDVTGQLLATESKEDKIEMLQNHITNLNSLQKYVESFFEAWIQEQKQI